MVLSAQHLTSALGAIAKTGISHCQMLPHNPMVYDVDGNKIHVRAREEVAIAFQHEIDHLNGIIFVDHIDPKNPFKGKDKMRAI